MSVKEKAYTALKKLGGRATESELVEKYIELFPDYAKNHNPTEKTSKEKIRGTISSVLILNGSHEKIEIDKNVKPQEYYIIDRLPEVNNSIVIQPIGKNNTIENFLNENRTRWAEKIRYKKEWEQSEGSTVLFIRSGEIFAQGKITSLEISDDDIYPLNYYYDLTLVDNIDYNKIIEYAEPKLGNFRTYELLNNEKSVKILNYIYSLSDEYLDETEADLKLQEGLEDIPSFEPELKPQRAKDSKKVNGNTVFPRNLAYAKLALEKANYLCELNSSHNTFISKSSNNHYMEAHHLIPLKFQDEFVYSLDIPANIIALCPNCHRKIHFGSNEDNTVLETLLNKRKKDLETFGIEISLDDLEAIYT